MSVVSVRETTRSRGGDFNFTEKPSDKSTRSFDVKTNSATDDEHTIYASGMVPRKGSVHPKDPTKTCRTSGGKSKNGAAIVWDWDCEYSNAPLREPPEDNNPLHKPLKVRMRGQQYTRSTLTDRDDKPLKNSAGDLFDPVDIDDVRWVLECEKNYAADSIPSFILTMANRINADDWLVPQLGLTLPAKTGKVQDLDISDIQTEKVEDVGDVQYRTVKFCIHHKEQGWKIRLADRGFYLLDASNERRKILVWSKMPGGSADAKMLSEASSPQFLDGEGSPLGDAAVKNGDLVYLEFDPFKEFDYSQLPTA